MYSYSSALAFFTPSKDPNPSRCAFPMLVIKPLWGKAISHNSLFLRVVGSISTIVSSVSGKLDKRVKVRQYGCLGYLRSIVPCIFEKVRSLKVL
jgi:hypothetical protein